MKNVVVLYKEMDCGGIESSLFHFMDAIKEKVNLQLVTWMKGLRDNEVKVPHEVLMSKISKNLHIIKKNKSNIKNEPLIVKIKWLFYKLLMKLKIFDRYVVSKFKTKKYSFVADVGICFAPWEISLRLYKKMFKCQYNICIIHGDVRSIDMSGIKKLFKVYDKILCVSVSCAEVFKKVYPEMRDKVDFIYNFQNINSIIEGAQEYSIICQDNCFKIVSVSRLSEEKGHIRFLNVIKKLYDEGFKFSYTIVGDGPEKQNIVDFINKNNMQDYVKMVGNKPNPYPYIKSADLFVLPSYHEAAPMVFAESMILQVPVLTTNTCSAEELVGELGFVCENSEEGIYDGLKYVLKHIDELKQKREKLKNYTYPNEEIKEKWLNFFS